MEGEEVTTEPIPDLVLNGVHEEDDECDRQKEQVKVPNEVERSEEETSTASSRSRPSQEEEEEKESTVKAEEIPVEFTPDTHLNSEALGEAESSSSSSNNSTSVTPTVIVVESNPSPDVKVSETSNTHLTTEQTGNIICKQDQIGEETAKVVLGEEEEVETAPSNEPSSNNDTIENEVNKINNNNVFNQHNNNNNKETLNEANNNHSSPKVEMKSETNDVPSPNGVPINTTVTVASKLTADGLSTNGVIDSPDGKDSAGDSIPASPTSVKSAASSNASSNGCSSTGGSTTNGISGYKRSSLTGIIDRNLEMTLNMSVSEMRQFLAQKKKQDPKKIPMDLKQKYEIISTL